MRIGDQTSRLRVCLAGLLACLLWVGVPSSAEGQSWEQRLEHYKRQQRSQAAPAARSIGDKLGAVIDHVLIEDAPADQAFEWWSQTTGIELLIIWEALENEGLERDTPINLNLTRVPAGRVLALLMEQAAGEFGTELIYEASPGLVEIMTKSQANKHTVTRMYFVGDLLFQIPHFTDAPDFSLSSSLRNGDSDSGGSVLFDDDRDEEAEASVRSSKDERVALLIGLIQDSIEPDIWRDNGGEIGNIHYFRDHLIIKAPLYVHRQIGTPVSRGARHYKLPAVRRAGTPIPNNGHTPESISGVNEPSSVSSVRDRP